MQSKACGDDGDVSGSLVSTDVPVPTGNWRPRYPRRMPLDRWLCVPTFRLDCPFQFEIPVLLCSKRLTGSRQSRNPPQSRQGKLSRSHEKKSRRRTVTGSWPEIIAKWLKNLDLSQ